MRYSKQEIQWVFERMKGHCFYCGMKIAMGQYRLSAHPGAWDINNFIPTQAKSEQKKNWVPACVHCNASKGQLLPWEYDPARFCRGDEDPDSYIATK